MNVKTSSSKRVFFTRNIKQLKWVVFANWIVLTLFYPLNIYFSFMNKENQVIEKIHGLLNLNGTTEILMTIAVFPMLYGLLSFKYLTNTGQSMQVHSMPITRKQLFQAHAGSGFLAICLPYLLTSVLLLGLQLILPAHTMNSFDIGIWMGFSLFFSFVFYSAAVLSSMVIGNTLLQAAFTYILLIFPTGIYYLVSNNLSVLLRGYFSDNSTFVLYLSPFTGLLALLRRISPLELPGWFWLYCIFFCCTFLIAAYLIYQTKSLEYTGETVQIKGVTPFLRTLGIYCTILLFGLIIKDVTNNNATILLGYLLGGAIGYVFLEMAIQKTMHCQLSLKIFSVTMGCFLVVFALIGFDLTQYGSRTMETDDIESIYFNNSYAGLSYFDKRFTFSDPATINAIQEVYLKSLKISNKYPWLESESHNNEYYFVFHGKNGKSFTRRLPIDKNQLNTELSHALTTPSYLKAKFPFLAIAATDVETLRIQTALGEMVLSDRQTINKIVQAAQSDILNNALVTIDQQNRPIFKIIATVPTTAPSYPFVASDDNIVEERIEFYYDVLLDYKQVTQVVNSYPELSKLLVTPDQVSRILIKPVSADEDTSNTRYYSSYDLSTTDPKVIVIEDKAQIATLLTAPISNYGESSKDYRICFHLNGTNTDYLDGYLLERNLPEYLIN